MVFECVSKNRKKNEKWNGVVSRLTKHGQYYEMLIQSRSRIVVIFGKSSQGGFACMPDFGAGCYLADLKDKFWNTEKLISVLGKVDGITVANALYSIADFFLED